MIKRRITNFLFVFLLALPASTNYELRGYGFGSGGTDDSTSANYGLNAIVGELSSGGLSGTNYNLGPGLNFVQQAAVPNAPTFTNDSDDYDKLHFIIDPSGNPSDSTFAIAISDDGFSTTNWVQDDNTVSPTLGIEDYQTYLAWGSAVGQDVIGLDPGVTYEICVKAMHGDFTETGLGPCATAATIISSLSFDLDIGSADVETAPPYQIVMGDLSSSVINTSSEYLWIDFSTNAESGGAVFIKGQNGGLNSVVAPHTILSLTGDLTSVNEGTGIVVNSVTQDSGGPFTVLAPYNGVGDNVGIVSTSFNEILSSSLPITNGRASFAVKAKIDDLTPSANDYSEVFTIVAAGSF